jgi:hypothetical protein
MKHQLPSPVTIFLKHFYRHRSFQPIQQAMQRIDVFDPALTNEVQNEHTFSSFSNLRLIPYVRLLIDPCHFL